MDFNSTLFLEQARALKDSGLVDAGYTLISAGGSTYAHQRSSVSRFMHQRMEQMPLTSTQEE